MKKIKTLHLISRLDPGGVEKWLIELSKNSSSYFEHHVLCISGRQGAWANQIDNDLIHFSPNIKKGLSRFPGELYKFILNNNFDIVHSHLYRFSSLIAIVSKLAKTKFIAHSHNDKRILRKNQSLLSATKEIIASTSTKLIFTLLADARVERSRASPI